MALPPFLLALTFKPCVGYHIKNLHYHICLCNTHWYTWNVALYQFRLTGELGSLYSNHLSSLGSCLWGSFCNDYTYCTVCKRPQKVSKRKWPCSICLWFIWTRFWKSQWGNIDSWMLDWRICLKGVIGSTCSSIFVCVYG